MTFRILKAPTLGSDIINNPFTQKPSKNQLQTSSRTPHTLPCPAFLSVISTLSINQVSPHISMSLDLPSLAPKLLCVCLMTITPTSGSKRRLPTHQDGIDNYRYVWLREISINYQPRRSPSHVLPTRHLTHLPSNSSQSVSNLIVYLAGLMMY